MLRDTLLKTQRVGVARVVIQTKQHLAVLVPSGPGLVLNLLRWGADIRSWEGLSLPPEGSKAAGLSDKELAMAKQLVEDMSSTWEPATFRDSFKDEIMALVAKKVKAGNTETVSQPEQEQSKQGSAQIIDLTELLQRSLRKTGTVDKAGTAKEAVKTKSGAKTVAKPAAKSTATRRRAA